MCLTWAASEPSTSPASAIPNTFLPIAAGSQAPIHAFGDEVTKLTRIEDYREVAGVLFPFRLVTVEMPSGKPLFSMQWESIEVNVDLPDDWFSPPQFERTPIAAFIEHLYGQRDDLSALLWTYHEFRFGWPEVNTLNAASTVGYQMLKMGQVDNAIALLEQNLADNPGEAEAHFQVGRAYHTAGEWRRRVRRLTGRWS